ncbi:MAG: hypothetical protein AAGA68_08440 [Pseudomonadota bacterium]
MRSLLGMALLAAMLVLRGADASSRIYTRLPQYIDQSSLIVLGRIRSAQGERRDLGDGDTDIVTRRVFDVERVFYDASGAVVAGQQIEYLTSGGRVPGSDEEVVTVGGTRHYGKGARAVLFLPGRLWLGDRSPPMYEVKVALGPDGREYLLTQDGVLEDIRSAEFAFATASTADGRRVRSLDEVTPDLPTASVLLNRLQSAIRTVKETPVGRCLAKPLPHLEGRDAQWWEYQDEEPAGCAFSRDFCGWLTDYTLAVAGDPDRYLTARDALLMTQGYDRFIDDISRARRELRGEMEGWMLLAWHDPRSRGQHRLIYVAYGDERSCQATYLVASAGGGGQGYTLAHGASPLRSCQVPRFPVICDSAEAYEFEINALTASHEGEPTVFFVREDGDLCGLALPAGEAPEWLRELQQGTFLAVPWVL